MYITMLYYILSKSHYYEMITRIITILYICSADKLYYKGTRAHLYVTQLIYMYIYMIYVNEERQNKQ